MEDRFKVVFHGAPLGEAELVLVLLHGHGSRADELARPADQMLTVLKKHEERAAATTAVVLPEGPLGEGDLRAWWNMPPPSDVQDLEALAADTKPPEELLHRLSVTVKWLLESCPSPPVVVLGGFSQGAFLALHGLVSLRMEGVDVSGFLAISGFLYAPTVRLAADFVPDAPDDEPCGPLRIFVAHGEDDEVIPEMAMHPGIAAVRGMKAKTVCGVELESFFHEGGHEIGDGSAAAAGRWLRGMPRPKRATAAAAAPPASRVAEAGATVPQPARQPSPRAAAAPSPGSAQASSSSTAGAGGPAAAPSGTDDGSHPAHAAPAAATPAVGVASSAPSATDDGSRQVPAALPRRARPRPWAVPPTPEPEPKPPQPSQIRQPASGSRGRDEEGEFRPGDMVRMRGLRNATHLNGARGVLEVWDDESCTWELEVQTTHEHVFVKPANMERFTSEEERRRRAARRSLPQPSEGQLQELRRAGIPALFDAPQLHRVFWGSAGAPRPRGAPPPVGSEVAMVAGVPCYLFGMDRPRPSGGELPPTVMIFHGRCFDIAEAMSRVARAYVNSIGARVVLPVGAVKTSTILERARSLVAGLPRDFRAAPLVVHGVFSGSIPAVQVAAEQSQNDVTSARCQVLVLEQGVSSIDQIPGVVGVIGGVQNDPLCQEVKLRMTRCHIVLVEGAKEAGAFQKVDTVSLIAQCCPTPPTVLREDTAFAKGPLGEELLPDLRTAVLQGLRFGALGEPSPPTPPSRPSREVASDDEFL